MHRKNKLGKRILAYIMTFALCITMLPVGSSASEDSSMVAPEITDSVSLKANLAVNASPGSTILHIPTPPGTGEHHRYNPTPVENTVLPPLDTQFGENEQVRVTGPDTPIQLPPNVNGKYIHVYQLDAQNKIIAASAVMISEDVVTSPDKIADIFKNIHKDILEKTVENVLVTDRNLVDNAFGDYNQMHADMKAALTAEYQLLGTLLTTIENQAGGMFTDIPDDHYARTAVEYCRRAVSS